jgi:uncharacterized protein YhaN
VTERLAAQPEGHVDALDASWRALCRLRSNIEEHWLVQSRAESSTRALQEREAAASGLETQRHWALPARFGDLISLLVAGAGACVTARALRRDFFEAGLFTLLMIALLAVRLTVYGRANWAKMQDRKRRTDLQRIRFQCQELRDRRDADWNHAAGLAAAIRADAQRLGLPAEPAPDQVDECEQELARRLRAQGGRTVLSRLLQELLATQDEEQACAATVADAEDGRRALLEQWDGWRATVSLPEGVDPDGAAAGLRKLREIADAIADRETVCAELLRSEPEIATWEAEARRILGEVGIEVPRDLCGRALATELSILRRRVERNDKREAARAALEAESAGVQRDLEVAAARRQESEWEWNELVTASGARSEIEMRELVDVFRRRRDAERRVAELEESVAGGLRQVGDPSESRAELATGSIERWREELRSIEARAAEIDTALAVSEERWREAEPLLAAARESVEVPDLLLQREELRTALEGAAGEWRLLAVARGLVEQSLEERESARRHEVLVCASRVVAGLSAGAFTAITQNGKGRGLTLIDRNQKRVSVDASLDAQGMGWAYIAMRLGQAADLARRGTSVPVIVDDVLGQFSPDDARAVVREIATAARGHQVLYVTSDAATREALQGALAAFRVLEI